MEVETQILAKLEELMQKMSDLQSNLNISQITYFENLPLDAVVGTDYVSYKFNCSESAVIRGRFGTDQIPKIRNKPIMFLKRDVDAVFRALNKPISEVASEYRNKQKKINKRKNR